MTEFDNVLDGLMAHVHSRMEDGDTCADVAPGTLKALQQPVERGAAPRGLAPSGGAQSPARPSDAPPATQDTPAPRETLSAIAAAIAACTLCPLHATRTNTVPGQGNPHPDVLFVGEAPGRDEDLRGEAFVGRAGQLLTRMIAAMGYGRDAVFIGNILKCRPPNNRTPLPEEMQTCLPYLRRQIALLRPKVIVALGATAVKGLLDVQTGITKLRGRWHTFEGIALMPTFHPAYLLRNPAAKHDAWRDLQAVLKHLGRTAPRAGHEASPPR
jgi:uracil-DNA glycosylase